MFRARITRYIGTRRRRNEFFAFVTLAGRFLGSVRLQACHLGLFGDGFMTPHDEHLLYLRDRRAWAAYVAPNWVRMLTQADKPEKERLWRIAGPELKAAIRALRESELTRGEPGTFTK